MFVSYLRISQARWIRREVKSNAINGSWQCYTTDQQSKHHHIRKCGCEVHDLKEEQNIDKIKIQ